jgi:hypothetical protein
MPLEGKTTVDEKMRFEAERLSYEAARQIASKIAELVSHRTSEKRVVIAGVQLLADLSNLVATRLLLEGIESDYRALASALDAAAPPTSEQVPSGSPRTLDAATAVAAGVPALTPLASVVGAGLSLASLFREDVEYRGVKSEIDATALELELAARIRANGAAQVVVPDFLVFSDPVEAKHGLRARLRAAQSARDGAWSIVAPIVGTLAERESRLDAAVARNDQAAVDRISDEVRSVRRQLDPISARLARVDQRFSELLANLTKSLDTNGGVPMLARLLRAEAIREHRPVYVHVRTVAAGGANRVSRSLLRTLFVGDGLTSWGGVVVSWALLADDGSVEDSGILTLAHGAKFGRATSLRSGSDSTPPPNQTALRPV